jgi:hypothetical protein
VAEWKDSAESSRVLRFGTKEEDAKDREGSAWFVWLLPVERERSRGSWVAGGVGATGIRGTRWTIEGKGAAGEAVERRSAGLNTLLGKSSQSKPLGKAYVGFNPAPPGGG